MSEEDKEKEKHILDLSKKDLKKVPKLDDAQNVRVLILDENDLQRIDNIDSYLKIEKLSLSKNQLLRMYGVCRLHCLRELNLSFNGILSIEGLKECDQLRVLNLEGNNIKTIEHLNNNVKLEYLNLAENKIGSISDISFLKNLKELYLHGNRLSHLRHCEKYLPTSLEHLTLARNNINDLNEICALANLIKLRSITITENPCVSMTNGPNSLDGFDYRPFVLNWCMSLKVIDGFAVDAIENLKAEWLYSQGKGRQYRLGEQAALAKYLSTVCPLTGKPLENENERKLRLILSKAQHHQRQLQEEISENSTNSCNNSPSSGRKKPSSRIQSPRFSRLSGRQGSPDSMVSSYHGTTSSLSDSGNNSIQSMQMTTSLIENIKNDSYYDACSNNSCGNSSTKNPNMQETSRSSTPNQHNEQSYVNTSVGGPLAAASKMVPVPETLISPDGCPGPVAQRVTVPHLHHNSNPHNLQNCHHLQHSTVQNSKLAKNKDNKMNSPKVRSPNMKRSTAVERSPNVSPRKSFSKSAVQSQIHQVNSASSIVESNQKARFALNQTSRSSPAPDLHCDLSSDDDSDNINIDKLKTIRNKAAQRTQENNEVSPKIMRNEATDTAAIKIQKLWRGYWTRKKTKYVAEKLLMKRTQEYIEKLTKDMEKTKVQLENERKIQQLQMQAINALWKRISSMQTLAHVQSKVSCVSSGTSISSTGQLSEVEQKVISLDNSSTAIVSDLTRTCTSLASQVQQLQGSMREILNCLTIFCNIPQENVKALLSAGVAEALSANSNGTIINGNSCISKDSAGTQTEITAVHTPQVENPTTFPFTSKIRPSTLPLDGQNITLLKQSQSVANNNDSALSTEEIFTEEILEKVKDLENIQNETCNQDAGTSAIEAFKTTNDESI